MASMRIFSVVGARPQFVKAAVVSKALLSLGGISETIIHTGQHYDVNMSDLFFDEMGIPSPGYNLNIGSGSHAFQTGKILVEVERILVSEVPDLLLVYGDTNSTLAAALAAAKVGVPIAHVEAGLRSFNKSMPEEINRILTDHVSQYLFAPTIMAKNNLVREGFEERCISVVGDVMYDAAMQFGSLAESHSRVLERLSLVEKTFALATIHRAESTKDAQSLQSIFESLNLLSRHMRVVLPLHPRTRKAAGDFGLERLLENVSVIDPVGYLDMIRLERASKLIVTDSGGVQKEAFFFRVPCVTLRQETEWVELVKARWNILISPGEAKDEVERMVSHAATVGDSSDFYGSGDAAIKIAKTIGAIV